MWESEAWKDNATYHLYDVSMPDAGGKKVDPRDGYAIESWERS